MTINEEFQKQFGCITREQAIGYGLSERQVDYRIATGQWLVERPGVYRLAAVPPTWEATLFAATARTEAVVSHLCAAALWDLEVFHQPSPEVTIPEGKSTRRDDILVHESRQWTKRSQLQRRGLPTTGIERTILDCAAKVSVQTAERLAEAAIRKRLTSWLQLADCLSAHSARGRDGCLTLRQLLQVRLGNGTVPLSDFSRRIVHLLERANIPTPIVEYRISDDAGVHLLQVDLAWPSLKKAWELDGLQWHFGRDDIERDRRKRNAVIAQGWVIQEILWSMYVDDPGGLVRMCRQFLSDN
jgi:hypothetical protein